MYVCEGGHFWPSLCEALVVVVVAAPVLGNPGHQKKQFRQRTGLEVVKDETTASEGGVPQLGQLTAWDF